MIELVNSVRSVLVRFDVLGTIPGQPCTSKDVVVNLLSLCGFVGNVAGKKRSREALSRALYVD